MASQPLLQSEIAGVPCRRGKVRDVYDLGDRLVIVATDRISAFDWVLPTGIPDKGRVLTALTLFWLDFLKVPNHLLSTDLADDGPPRSPPAPTCWRAGRMLVRKAAVVPIECVVRGYLAGSGWKEYRQHGHGLRHPAAAGPAREPSSCPSRSSRRPPRRRAATTSTSPSSEMVDAGRRGRWPRSCGGAASTSTAAAAELRPARGASSSPTPSSSGAGCPTGELILIDEVLTPDSSRFWPADQYRAGQQPAVVRQAVRPRLAGDDRLGQEQPAAGTARRGRRADTGAKYLEAYERLTGKPLQGV